MGEQLDTRVVAHLSGDLQRCLTFTVLDVGQVRPDPQQQLHTLCLLVEGAHMQRGQPVYITPRQMLAATLTEIDIFD